MHLTGRGARDRRAFQQSDALGREARRGARIAEAELPVIVTSPRERLAAGADGDHVRWIDSPFGKGLLGKKQGDIADIHTPNGILQFEIIEISR